MNSASRAALLTAWASNRIFTANDWTSAPSGLHARSAHPARAAPFSSGKSNLHIHPWTLARRSSSFSTCLLALTKTLRGDVAYAYITPQVPLSVPPHPIVILTPSGTRELATPNIRHGVSYWGARHRRMHGSSFNRNIMGRVERCIRQSERAERAGKGKRN